LVIHATKASKNGMSLFINWNQYAISIGFAP
jgi:hypothetical protein